MSSKKLLVLPIFALAAASLAVSAQAAPEKPSLTVTKGGVGLPYALVLKNQGGGTMMSADSGDLDGISLSRRSIKGDFLWFRKDGKDYLVRDQALLAKVTRAYAPVNQASNQADLYDKQMDKLGKEMDKLAREMEDAVGDGGSRAVDTKRVEAIAKKMNEARKPIDPLTKKIEDLGEQMEVLERAAQKELRAVIDESLVKGLATPAPKR